METKEKKTAHSPLPWKAKKIKASPFGIELQDAHGESVKIYGVAAFSTVQKTRDDNESGLTFRSKGNGTMLDPELAAHVREQDANAALVVRAVNNHEELVALAKSVIKADDDYSEGNEDGSGEMMRVAAVTRIANAARALLAKIKG